VLLLFPKFCTCICSTKCPNVLNSCESKVSLLSKCVKIDDVLLSRNSWKKKMCVLLCSNTVGHVIHKFFAFKSKQSKTSRFSLLRPVDYFFSFSFIESTVFNMFLRMQDKRSMNFMHVTALNGIDISQFFQNVGLLQNSQVQSEVSVFAIVMWCREKNAES